MSKPAYLVVDAKSSDPQRLAKYRELAQIAVEKFGGRYVVRGEPYEVVEGEWRPQRLVIVEFPSLAVAKEFYASLEYRLARDARAGIADFQMLLVEGH